MKFSALFFSLFLAQILLGNLEVEPWRPQYEIVSDIKDSYISKGRCILEITVRDAKTNVELQNVRIISGKKTHKTNSEGFAKFSHSIAFNYVEFQLDNYKTGYMEDYEFKSKHRIKVNVYLMNQVEEQQYQVKKPVIYCYAEKELDFKFELKPKGELLFHYPPLNVGLQMINPKGQTKPTYTWNMSLKNNQLFTSDSVEYPYLFWESKQIGIQYKKNISQVWSNQFLVSHTKFDGSIILKENILSFLDSVLTDVGLNSKEKTDFITFWSPQMMEKEYYLIQFLQDEECEQFANYQIEPKPSKVNRIYMLFTGFDKMPIIDWSPQNLKKIERTGFYMVDWGGVEVPSVDFNRGGLYDEPLQVEIKN